MALSLQSKVNTGRICPPYGIVMEVKSHHPPCHEHCAKRGHPQKQRSIPLPIQSPLKPLPWPLISCVKTTNEVAPAQSLIGSMGQQLFICTSVFCMIG